MSDSMPKARAPLIVAHAYSSGRGTSGMALSSSTIDRLSFEAKESVPTQIVSPLRRSSSTGGRNPEM